MGELEKRKDGELSTIMTYTTPEIVKTQTEEAQVARIPNQSKQDISM
jgi:hypothetical protein